MLGMMDKKKMQERFQDRIDLELSRTYFRKAARNINRLRPVLIGLVIVLGLSILITSFFTQKRLIFNIDIKIEPAGKTAAQPVKEIKSPEAAKNNVVKTPSYSWLNRKRPVNSAKVSQPARHTYKDEFVIFDFEKDEEGWGIPAWALDKPDHVAKTLKRSPYVASNGKGSMEILADFQGGMWTAALAEIDQYLDVRDYEMISVDIYIPPHSPGTLRGKIILTVGEEWKFTEMSRSIRLVPGEWTTVSAKLTEDSMDWKRTKVDEAFKTDVRKIAIRIESDRVPYFGPVYIDNFRLSSDEIIS